MYNILLSRMHIGNIEHNYKGINVEKHRDDVRDLSLDVYNYVQEVKININCVHLSLRWCHMLA